MSMPALIVIVALIAPDTVNAKEQIEGPTKRVKELQKERVDTLKEVVEISLKLAKNARIELGELLEARMSLLKAELETAEKESDRIEFYKTTLVSLMEYEKLAKAQFEAGRGTELNVLKVKARRLEIAIQLERAKIRATDESK